MLDWVQIRTLAWPLHDWNVDSWVPEPVLQQLRSVLGIVVLLELVEKCPVAFEEILHKQKKIKFDAKKRINCAKNNEFLRCTKVFARYCISIKYIKDLI